MLKTVKSRMLFLTFLLLCILGLLTTVVTLTAFLNQRANRIENVETQVSYYSEKINKIIEQHKINVKSLAVMGTVFYTSEAKSKNVLNYATVKNFEGNLSSVGGGIWFEPYSVKPNQKRFCSYAFNNDGKVVSSDDFESEKYDYLNQMWYTKIKHMILTKSQNAFTPPYFDDEGTRALMITLGSGIYNNGKFVGMATVDWKLEEISKDISKLKPTSDSFSLFADKDNDFIIELTNSDEDVVGNSLKTISWYKDDLKSGSTINFNNKKYVTFSRILDNGLLYIVNVPTNELFKDLYMHIKLVILLMFLTLLLITGGMYYLLTQNVNKPIQYLVKMAGEIGNGDLNAKIKIQKPEEFAQLANAFNKMTTDIEEYITNLNLITAEKKRIETELNIAQAIQTSALPSIFPPYPERKEFDIFANMVTAKEVGGDFYDFFFIDDDNFAFLIADVSGKGIPAALFMMETKALLTNIIKTGIPLADAMKEVNNKLCQHNKQTFFVTIFLATVNLLTGKVTFVNAGHNPPLIKRTGKDFEYYQIATNIVAGAMHDFQYISAEDTLNVGDEIFLYTDGVTEAMNKNQQLYGEERLLKILNVNKDVAPEQVIPIVKEDIYDYTKGELQSDDITTLVFRYNGKTMDKKTDVKTLVLPAKIENFNTVLQWLDGLCDELSMKNEHKVKLKIAVEEIFVNISSYAYSSEIGDVEIIFKLVGENKIEMRFVDSGTPYNPLLQPEPDILASADERAPGGLGIFIVKKSMDDMEYEFLDNKNILTIRLNFDKK